MKIRFLICCFFFLGYTHVFCQHNFSKYEIKEYKGLYATVIEDHFGFIWLGSRDGLLRYDGSKLERISSEDLISKNSSIKVGKLIISGNHLLAASNNGLQIVNLLTSKSIQKYFSSYPSDEKLANYVIDIQISRYNEILILTATAIFVLNEAFEIINSIPLPEVYLKSGITTGLSGIVVLEDGKIWVEGFYEDSQIFHLSLDSASHSFVKEDPFDSNSIFHIIQFDPTFIIYASYPEKSEIGFIDEKTGAKRPLNINLDFITDGSYVSIFKISKGEILLVNNKDHYIINLASNSIIKLPPIYYDEDKTTPIRYMLYENRELNILGISEIGIIKFIDKYSVFRPLEFINEAFPENPNINVKQIFNDGEHEWIISHGSGGVILKNGQIESKITMGTPESPFPDYWWNITNINEKLFWIGTSKGLFWFDKYSKQFGRLENAGLPPAINNYSITTQFIDTHNNLWMGIGFGNGVVRWEPDRSNFKYYPNSLDKGGIPIRYPKTIAEDINGDLWMGCQTGGGLIKWSRSNDTFEIIKATINDTFNNDLIDVIAIGPDNNIYFGGGGGGVYSYNPSQKSFKNWSEDDGLSNNYINDLLWDNSGSLWVATQSGLNKLNIDNDNILKLYTTHGLPSDQVVSIQQLVNDSIIVHCLGGSSIFHPSSTTAYQPYSPVRITQLKINDLNFSDLLLESGVINLDYDQNNISFELRQVNLIDAEYSKYFYRELNNRKEWQSLSSNSHLNLFGIAPGNYDFQFRICSNGNVCKESQVISLRIKPPFWKSNLFYLSILVLFGGILWMYFQLRLGGIKKNIELRENISKDLHDDIGSSLSSIQFLSEMIINAPKDEEGNKSRIYSIKEEISNVSQNVEEIIWHIKPSNDQLDKVLLRLRRFTTEILEAKGIDLLWDQSKQVSDIKLSAAKKRDYFLIFKEIVNNIAKHSKAQHVHVQIKCSNGIVVQYIKDDGEGFDVSQEFNTTGIESIKTRAISLDGQLEIQSELSKGSTIKLEFPAS